MRDGGNAGSIFFSDAATVEQRDMVTTVRIEKRSKVRMRLLDFLRRCGNSCPDCPDRLVCANPGTCAAAMRADKRKLPREDIPRLVR